MGDDGRMGSAAPASARSPSTRPVGDLLPVGGPGLRSTPKDVMKFSQMIATVFAGVVRIGGDDTQTNIVIAKGAAEINIAHAVTIIDLGNGRGIESRILGRGKLSTCFSAEYGYYVVIGDLAIRAWTRAGLEKAEAIGLAKYRERKAAEETVERLACAASPN